MCRIVFKCSVLVLVVMLLADVSKLIFTGESSLLAFYDDIKQGRLMDIGAEHLTLKAPEIPRIDLPDVNAIKELEVFKGESEPSLVYKWVDESGVVHYGSERPSNVDATEMLVDPNAEHLKLMPQTPPPEEASSSSNGSFVNELGINDGGLKNTGIEELEVRKLFDDARNIQHLLDERSRRLKVLLSDNLTTRCLE